MASNTPGEFWVASITCLAPVVARRLGDFIVADDVQIDDETGAWRGVALLGPGTGAWLAAGTRAGLVFPGRRDAGESWEWIHPAADADAVHLALAGAPVADPAEIERRRIAAGIPAVPADIGPGELPNEGGLDAGAISYSKGATWARR